MSYNNYGSGLYGQTSPSGAPIGLTPATLRAEIVDPTIRALLAGSSAPPDANTTQGLLNWAGSQGRSNRAIMPTIPGLTLPAQIRQILQQPSLASIAQNLQGQSGQGPVNPATGGFAQPAGGTAGAPTSQTASTQSSDNFVSQIVAKAVASVLSQTAESGGGGPSSGGSGGGPEPGSGGGPAKDAPAGGGQQGVGGEPGVAGAGVNS